MTRTTRERRYLDTSEAAAAIDKKLSPPTLEKWRVQVDRSGICYEVRTHVTKALNRVREDESFFGIIHTIDDDDDYDYR